ncbi:MAG: hypothetical protein ACLGI2_04765 [Acidimicrobiia bacterium]
MSQPLAAAVGPPAARGSDLAGKRRLRILAKLVIGGPELETRRLCVVCAEVTGVSGAGIMLMAGDEPRGSMCATDDVSALVEQLPQLEVGLGQALIRLRAYAFGNDRPLTEVAEDVVARRLRFDHRSGEKDPPP